jgi:hypothetical protein
MGTSLVFDEGRETYSMRLMIVLRQGVLVLTCLMAASCSASFRAPRQMVVHWENYSKGTEDPGHAQWYFNHHYIGEGRSAFQEILVSLYACPSGSMLSLGNAPFHVTPSSPVFMHPPFYEFLDEFVNLLIEKQMIVRRQGYATTLRGVESERDALETMLWGVVEVKPSLKKPIPEGYTPFLDKCWLPSKSKVCSRGVF